MIVRKKLNSFIILDTNKIFFFGIEIVSKTGISNWEIWLIIVSCWWTRCPIKNLEQTFPLTRVPLPHFHISSHFDGLALPFRAARFSEQLLSLKTNLFEIKITTEELLFRSRYFTHYQTFQKYYFFDNATSSKEALFQNNFFREAVRPSI